MSCIVGLSSSNPNYTLLRAIHDFEQYGKLVKYFARITIGSVSTVVANMVFSTVGVCTLFVSYSIVFLLTWTSLLVPELSKGKFKLRSGMNFDTAVRIYFNLKVMTKVQGEAIRGLILPCLHHINSVGVSTAGLFYLMEEIIDGNPPSPFVILGCLPILIVPVAVEWYAVYWVALSGVRSKEFIQRMRVEHGGNKYRRKMLNCLLPNTINLEFLETVETLKNGIGMQYFLNYFARVTDSTATLLLTRDRN